MQKALIALVVVIILAAGGLALTRNDKSSKNSTGAATSNNTSQQAPLSANSVTIKDMAFSPADITVAKGTKVTWTNNDSTAHTVTGDSEHGPNSQPIEPGKSYSFTFADEGTFNYHCTIHPEMTGTVTVTSASNTSTQSNTNQDNSSGNTTPSSGNPY